MLKRVEDQNYYQILEVPYQASWGEVQKGYELVKATYSKGAMASYSLFDFTERGTILDKIEEAYHVLSHPEKRYQYDQALSATVPELAKQQRPVPLLPLTPEAIAALRPLSVAPAAPAAPAPATLAPLPAPDPVKTEIETAKEDSTAGARFRSLREKQGVSLAEIADKTRINIVYLEYIEANRYGALPAPVYVLGYLKQYAKIVGMDNAIVDQYMSEYQQWTDKKPGSR
jgi:curved DNA-binding protein CbpA